MNEERFVAFMKANKKPESNIKHYLGHVRTFEEYLASQKGGLDVDDATVEDL